MFDKALNYEKSGATINYDAVFSLFKDIEERLFHTDADGTTNFPKNAQEVMQWAIDTSFSIQEFIQQPTDCSAQGAATRPASSTTSPAPAPAAASAAIQPPTAPAAQRGAASDQKGLGFYQKQALLHAAFFGGRFLEKLAPYVSVTQEEVLSQRRLVETQCNLSPEQVAFPRC